MANRVPGLLCSSAADYHELDEAEVVQAQVPRDVPAVHVHLPLLPRVSHRVAFRIRQPAVALTNKHEQSWQARDVN
jgi:hypothetical protein